MELIADVLDRHKIHTLTTDWQAGKPVERCRYRALCDCSWRNPKLETHGVASRQGREHVAGEVIAVLGELRPVAGLGARVLVDGRVDPFDVPWPAEGVSR